MRIEQGTGQSKAKLKNTWEFMKDPVGGLRSAYVNSGVGKVKPETANFVNGMVGAKVDPVIFVINRSRTKNMEKFFARVIFMFVS